jgi:spermidine synthase|nr:fused MFS/spermidine synthase [Candidatus Krumholzibacteria bacterium]
MSSRKSSFLPSHPVHLLVFLAGFTFLVYEVSWSRLLSLTLGSTVTSATIVLASFMAGFGYGALFWGRRAVGRRNLGGLTGLLIMGMGAVSALNYFLFHDVFPHLYLSFSAAGGMSDVLMYLLAGVLLVLPAFLMGGVFPVASRLAAEGGRPITTALGHLYASETLGSALGGLATGFVLLGAVGQKGTILLAVGINAVTGIWALVDRRFRLAETAGLDVEDQPVVRVKNRKRGDEASRMRRDHLLRAAVVGAFACGFSLLTLQILWMRVFKVYLTNTSYTFALISSVAILGIFVGSTWYRKWVASQAPTAARLVQVMAGMTLATLLGLVLLVKLPQALMFPLQGLLTDPGLRVLGFPVLAALLIVFPPAVGSGFAFPLVCSMFTTSRQGMSGDVGFVLMVNTIGSVFGPLVAAFVLIPGPGAVLGILAVAAWLAAGALLVGRGVELSPVLKASLAGVLVVTLIMLVIRPEIRTLPPSFIKFDREILYYEEAVEGTIAVGRDRDTRTQAKYTFVNNSAVIGSSYDAIKVVKMVGHYPFLMGAEIKDVLVIGFGIGVTTSAIASHREVETITCVELVEGLTDAAVHYRDRNRNVLQDPRLTVEAGDGRHFLQKTNRQFDLISCDPTHPILGSGNLYTRDYFELCREHLNPGGMVSQYLPLHKLRQEDLLGLIATFAEVFPDCSVWLGHYHAVLLGSNRALDFDFPAWQERVAKLDQDNDFYIDPHHLAATLVLDGPGIAALGQGTGINTDDLSYTDFFDTDCLLPGNTAANLLFLQENRRPVARVFQGIEDKELMDRFVRGNALLNESLYRGLLGERRASLTALQQAAQVNPENGEYPFLIKLNF